MRVFDVKLQGQTVLKNLDIFARVGKNRALDYTFTNIVVTNGWLDIDFVPRSRVSQHRRRLSSREAASPGRSTAAARPTGITRPTCRRLRAAASRSSRHQGFLCGLGRAANSGAEIGAAAAAIFAKMDGALPKPCTWVAGPGGIQPDGRPWEQVKQEYAFVDEFAALRPGCGGRGQPGALRLLAEHLHLFARGGRSELRLGRIQSGDGESEAGEGCGGAKGAGAPARPARAREAGRGWSACSSTTCWRPSQRPANWAP